MPAALWTWLTQAKLRRRLARPTPTQRAELVARLAPGRSFLDMGGMWGVDGEFAFLAEQAGASRIVLCDGMAATEEFWRKHRERSSAVEYVHGDLHDPLLKDRIGTFDVVWCTGVIYHSPDPYRLIEHLRDLTVRTLVLGTRTIPEVPGIEGACIFYPALSEPALRTFAWMHGRERTGVLGAAMPFDPAQGYANYWWGITPSALLGMLTLARFKVTERHQPHPLSIDVVAEAVEGIRAAPPVPTAANPEAIDLKDSGGSHS